MKFLLTIILLSLAVYTNTQCSTRLTQTACNGGTDDKLCDWIEDNCYLRLCSKQNHDIPRALFKDPANSFDAAKKWSNTAFTLTDMNSASINDGCFSYGFQYVIGTTATDYLPALYQTSFGSQSHIYQIPSDKFGTYCTQGADAFIYNCKFKFSLYYKQTLDLSVVWTITQTITIDKDTSDFKSVTINSVEHDTDAGNISVNIKSEIKIYEDNQFQTEKTVFDLGDIMYVRHEIVNSVFRGKFSLSFGTAKITSAGTQLNLDAQSEAIDNQDNSSGLYSFKTKYTGDFTLTIESTLNSLGNRRLLMRRNLAATYKDPSARKPIVFIDTNAEKEKIEKDNSDTIVLIAIISGAVVVMFGLSLVAYVIVSKQRIQKAPTTAEQQYIVNSGVQQSQAQQFVAKEV